MTQLPLQPETITKIETRTRALVNAMSKREYQIAGAHFDANMTSLMPAGKIEEFWKAIQDKVGPFVEQVSVSVTNHAAALICKFEKERVDIYVTFDAACNVSGLHVGPAPAGANAVTLTEATSQLAGAALERARTVPTDMPPATK